MPKTSHLPKNTMDGRVCRICKHLKEGMEFLDAQEKALHEIIHAVEGIGQLVLKREATYFPRTPENHLQSEFEILLNRIEAVRVQTHFNKALFGNAGSPPLKIHVSLASNPRYEEVHLADLEALHLRMIYWGKLAGDGSKALIGRETVEIALKHLLEMAIRSRSQRDRLEHVHSELARYLNQTPPATPSSDPGKDKGEDPSQPGQAQEPPGLFQALKDKLLGTKGNTTD